MTCPKWARRDQRRALQAGLIESRRALMLCRWLMVDQVETEQVGQALSPANSQTRIIENAVTMSVKLYLPCFHPLAVFLPRLGTHPMLLLSWVRKYALVAIFLARYLLASKRCFSGGTDTSRRLLRPCGTHRAVRPMWTDGRNVKSISQPRNVRLNCLDRSKVSENQALNWGAWRHSASSTLKMRFKSLAAAP